LKHQFDANILKCIKEKCQDMKTRKEENIFLPSVHRKRIKSENQAIIKCLSRVDNKNLQTEIEKSTRENHITHIHKYNFVLANCQTEIDKKY